MLNVTPLRAILGFSDTLGHTLVMDTQNRLRKSTDAQTPS